MLLTYSVDFICLHDGAPTSYKFCGSERLLPGKSVSFFWFRKIWTKKCEYCAIIYIKPYLNCFLIMSKYFYRDIFVKCVHKYVAYFLMQIWTVLVWEVEGGNCLRAAPHGLDIYSYFNAQTNATKLFNIPELSYIVWRVIVGVGWVRVIRLVGDLMFTCHCLNKSLVTLINGRQDFYPA